MVASLDPSDDFDHDPSLMVDQDSDGYWDQAVSEAWEGVGPIMWGLGVAMAVLSLYLIVGAFE